MGNKKLHILINEGLSLAERQDLISLIQEYIDVFDWNYENIPDLIL